MKRAKDYFLLNWEKLLLVILLTLSSIFLHNIISAKFNIEEPVFFIISLLLGLYLVISSIYTLFYLTKKRSHLAVLIWSFIIVILVAFLGSIFTSKSVNTEWYQNIKPSITPPSFVFPIAWSILFFLIALSLYLVWIFSTKQEKRKIILVYGLNFVLNILWSVLYFGLHQTKLAFFEIIILFLSILLMISVSYKIKRMSSYLLVPYLLWVGFASVLTYLSAFI